jgi:hypothetical protein
MAGTGELIWMANAHLFRVFALLCPAFSTLLLERKREKKKKKNVLTAAQPVLMPSGLLFACPRRLHQFFLLARFQAICTGSHHGRSAADVAISPPLFARLAGESCRV